MKLPPADPALVLRDIHQPPMPPWWPPAPGWWVLGAALLALVAALAWWLARRQRRRRAMQRLFDDSVDHALTPEAQVAAMSSLLRRAARERDAQAAALHGDEWLQYLDAGARTPLFNADCGRLLLEGGYRVEVDAGAVATLRPRARQRFLEWMGAA